jgi:hypothetical protein
MVHVHSQSDLQENPWYELLWLGGLYRLLDQGDQLLGAARPMQEWMLLTESTPHRVRARAKRGGERGIRANVEELGGGRAKVWVEYGALLYEVTELGRHGVGLLERRSPLGRDEELSLRVTVCGTVKD